MTMDDELPADDAPDASTPGGAPDLRKLGDMLRAMADQISAMQGMLPQDDGEDRAATIDDATEEAQETADADGPGAQSGGTSDPADKADAKAAAAAMIARQLK